ncbi:BON domain-containing protein [Candidatus Thioglobus sp. NP1]|uniref:BON domain-containing protein n=1 Tax=Candidatus Thioglobus sp. NP1 TaxID=2508687 RepID=UPI000DEDDA2C|nr:BON domain-containing protein [Candidatus Thioglobus sp. NP1]AXE61408.1 BON domain-containing protein [Candidatus Thioglobus sp. NP1]
MKKVILLGFLLISASFLSSCSPIIQGAAAVTTVATMANDRRSMGEILDDKALYMDLSNLVNKDPMLDDAHINFNVFNKSVLMTGEAPDDDLKNYLEEQVKRRAPLMKQLINEVEVMPNSSYLSRAKDGVISVQIEALFLDQEVFHPRHVSVLTERKTVYLMGSVTKREAEHATNVASKAKNVNKVVKLFNYLLVRPAEEIERDNKKKEDAERKAELDAKRAELEAAQAELQRQMDELNSN